MALSYTFSISFKTGCYRHIKISAEASLYVFHKAIVEAFGLSDGHMHVFFMNNCAWDNTCGYYCTGFAESKNPATDEVRLCDFKPEKNEQFIYIYDFGSELRFSVRLLYISEEETKKPVLIRSKGEFFLSDRQIKTPDYEAAEEKFELNDCDKKQLLHLYACAAVNLYGIVSVSTFCKIFNGQNEMQTNEAEATQILLDNRGREYAVCDGFLVFPAEEEIPLLVERLRKQIKGKPRYVPDSREMFLKYLDFYYMENAEIVKKIKNFFSSLFDTENEVFAICGEFMQMLRLDYPVQAFAELPIAYGLAPEAVNQSFFNLVIEAKNSSRIWINKGFTPPEFARLNGTARQILHDVGRNDPCPCGSGKKYKKCCGAVNKI